jgi:hypothetical protein
MNHQQFEDRINTLDLQHRLILQEKGAVEMLAGKNFIAWVKVKEPDSTEGKYQAEVWSWGQKQEPMFSNSIEDLEKSLIATFDEERERV